MGSPLLLRKDSENRVQRQTRTRSRFGSAETRLSSWNKDTQNRSKKGFERVFIWGGSDMLSGKVRVGCVVRRLTVGEGLAGS